MQLRIKTANGSPLRLVQWPRAKPLRRVVSIIALFFLAMTSPSPAETLHLTGGMTIEVQSVEDRGSVYRVKSWQGTYDIEKSRVERIETGPGLRENYESEKKRHADSAVGHLEMARWCRLQGLLSERMLHLRRVIELDSDHAEARKALGYVRKKGAWIKSRSAKAPTDDEREARRLAKAQDDEIRERVSGWFVKIKAIQSGRLDPGRNDAKRSQFADGRRQILAIRDPFAIQPLAEVLSRGDLPTRLLLVEALARFEQDEAPMNLIVLALLDPLKEVRQAATSELAKKKDERIVTSLRQALNSEKEWTIRSAATALGGLKARSAVPDLINLLSTETIATVRVSDPLFLDYIMYLYGRSVRYGVGANVLLYRPHCIGVLGPGALVGTIDRYQLTVVSVYRTEVQEALISITGQNLGFDRAAWADWWKGQRQ